MSPDHAVLQRPRGERFDPMPAALFLFTLYFSKIPHDAWFVGFVIEDYCFLQGKMWRFMYGVAGRRNAIRGGKELRALHMHFYQHGTLADGRK